MKNKALPIVVFGALVPVLLLLWLYFIPKPSSPPAWSHGLAPLNACLNSLSALFLICGYVAIKKGHEKIHIRCMLSALTCSAFFLVSYLLYHHFHGDSKFMGEGSVLRGIYFFILISHILLSMLNFPMILLTLYHALSQHRELHKKWARRTLPIWLYVSVTGVVIYGFLKIWA
jgi:putative membrane protein